MSEEDLLFTIDDINTTDEELTFPEGHFDVIPDIIQEVLEVHDEPEPELTDEQKELLRKKQKAQRCKVIVLSKMDLDPLTNVSALSYNTKIKIIESVTELFRCEDDDIIKQFNDIVNNNILKVEKDYTKYPIYKTNI